MQRKTGEVIHRQCRSKQLADSSPLNLPLVYWAIAANGKSSHLLAMDHATAEKAEKALFELEDGWRAFAIWMAVWSVETEIIEHLDQRASKMD